MKLHRHKLAPRSIYMFVVNSKPEKLFLIVALPLLVLFALAIPAFQGWDETTHFLRAYQISEGKFVSERFKDNHVGGKIPTRIVQLTDAATTDLVKSAASTLNEKTDIGYYSRYADNNLMSNTRIEKYFGSSAVYSPVSYAPQAVGIFIARATSLPLIAYDYIGRIFGIILYLLLVYWGIKLATKGKWVLFAISILPTSLTNAASLSPDLMVIGASILLTGLFLKLLFDPRNVRLKHLLLVALAIVILALTKQAYFLFGFLFICIPPKNFGGVKKYLSWNALFIFLTVGVTLGWYLIIKDIAQYVSIEHRPGANVNPSDQISFITHNPIKYSLIFLWQLVGQFNPKYLSAVGLLTWKGIVMPHLIIFLIYLGVGLAYLVALSERLKEPIYSKRDTLALKLWPLVIGALILVAVYTSLYVAFTEVGKNVIDGVQGRYLIPILLMPLPFLLLIKQKKKPIISINVEKAKFLLLGIFVTQNIIALITIVATNYIPNIKFI